MKKYILIAGVNGAGKSTLYQSLQSLQGMPRVNTDEILRDFGDWRNMADVMTAGKIAVKKIARYFDEGITFNQETTLCGKSIINNSTFPADIFKQSLYKCCLRVHPFSHFTFDTGCNICRQSRKLLCKQSHKALKCTG